MQVDNEQLSSNLAATGATGTATSKSQVNGGRFDFDDGGTYCGGWEEGKAHGHGVCTGPKGQGAYSGSWHYGFEVSGVYTWPSGSCFEGQWQNGKRHGLGVETRGRWIYRGEWTQGFKGRYGVRQSNNSLAKYEGTWANGLQDGYGSETYADEGTYQGQWMRGMRHGYGVRTSATFGKASKYRASRAMRSSSQISLRNMEGGAPSEPEDKRDRNVDETRGGFVLQSKSSEALLKNRRNSFDTKKSIFKGILKKGASTGDIDKKGGTGSIRSTASSVSYLSTDSAGSSMTNASMPSESNASFVIEDEHMDPSVTETYMGEWKNDKRSGYGISERSDGLKYEGEWYANKKYGYGVTTFVTGEKEEGKYKNNVLITSQRKKLFLMRSAKFRERIDAAVNAAQRASKIALQKADIAISRTATARSKAEQADTAAAQAREDADVAETVAKKYAPDFKQPSLPFKLRQKYQTYSKSVDIPVSNEDNVNRMMSNPTPNHITSNIVARNPNVPNSVIPNQNAGDNPKSNRRNSNLLQQQNRPSLNKSNFSNSITEETNANFVSNNNYINSQQPNSYGNKSQNPYQTQPNPYANQNANPYGNQNIQNNPYPNQQNNPYLENQSIQSNSYANKPYANPPNQYATQSQQNQQYSNQNTQPNNPYASHNDASQLQQNTSENYSSQNNRRSSGFDQNLIRNATRRKSGDRPYMGSIGHQTSIDHFDHYLRPPSRDSSVDRYTRAMTPMGSRQPSVDRTSRTSVDRTSKNGFGLDATQHQNSHGHSRPINMMGTSRENGGTNFVSQGIEMIASGVLNNNNFLPFEDKIIKNKGLGQDIIPSPNQPKRTESLLIQGQKAYGAVKQIVTQTSLSRKKSLPDVQELPRATRAIPREEVSALGSARREEVRRQIDERERLRANPLLYLVSPQVKDWFARQQLVLVVLFINISLAIMFFKLLT